jgi:hypothetical protein
MAWYIRKSFKVGPLLRLNLSKSGLGYSFGIKGARIGTGPRGNYVHVGRYGLYYRQSLPYSGQRDVVRPPDPSLLKSASAVGQEEQIATAEVSVLKDQSAQGLLSEIQQKHRILRLAPIAAGACALLFVLLLVEGAPIWLVGVPLLLGTVLSLALDRYDRAKKTVFLHFDLDDSMQARYESLSNALKNLSSCSMVWRLWTKQSVRDSKYYASAQSLVSKKRVSVKLSSPPFVQTELQVWCLALGNQTFYLFPDRILIYAGSSVGALSYSDLQVRLGQTRFVERSSVPPDTTIVDYTWRYTNRDGGPDRRFSNNPRIPVVQYSEIQIKSTTGVNILLQASNLQKASEFAQGINQYIQNTNSSDTLVVEKVPHVLDTSSLTTRESGSIGTTMASTQTRSDQPRSEGTMFCTSCGAKNPSGARFCNQCGKSLITGDAVDPAVIPTAGNKLANAAASEVTQTTAETTSTPGTDRGTSLVLVDIQNKRYQQGDYENYIWWDAVYNPVGLPKRTRAIKGTVEFADLFGEVHFALNVVINDPMDPGRKLATPGVGFTYNQFMDAHQWMLSTDVSNMMVKFRIKSIIYADGSIETL